MQIIEVPSRIRPYTIHFSDSWTSLNSLTEQGEYLCVVDENIWNLYQDKLPLLKAIPESNRLVLSIHEDYKTLTGVERVYDALIERASKKNISLIAIGGGILQDVVGFAASTLYRGVRWVYVPTTLLAQADSCIGGKTSLNYKGFKNLLGTFYPPFEIHILPAFLGTLTNEDYFSGLGEVVKLHLLAGAKKTAWYAAHEPAIARREPDALGESIQNSLGIKISYLAEDEFDQGKRNMLNFGHCYGHALESVSHFEIQHGQAVFIGMLFADIIARNRNLQSAAFEASTRDLIRRHIVSKLTLEHFSAPPLLAAMRKDKKRVGQKLSIILLSDQHQASRVSDLTEAEFQTANEELIGRLANRLPVSSKT